MDKQPYDPLTRRELDILNGLAHGLSNREIADELVVATETVRWYTKQIYSKLGVGGRVQALNRARELGLLIMGPPSQQLPTGTAITEQQGYLPAYIGAFVGREREVADLRNRIGNIRLVTLTGMGGIGKTRLALHVAGAVREEFPDGVYFIDLAPLTDTAMVAGAIAKALGVAEPSGQTLSQALTHRLHNKRLLLVLDNFEHLLSSAYEISELLASSLHLHVLATSREPLHIYGEQEYPVSPLATPGSGTPELQALAKSDSIRLFIQTAQAVRPDFTLTENNAADIAAICIRLEGVPLAIELAAARIKILSPQMLLTRLTSLLDTLTGGANNLPLRQRTLRNTVAWSHSLLADGERTLFARLAVFRSASLEAIQSVCSEGLTLDFLDGIRSLVDKSLVQQKETSTGEPRFLLLETVHEYAMERLRESGEIEELRSRHARYFTDLTLRAQPHLRQSGYKHWFTVLTIELDNIRTAIEWSLSGDRPEHGLHLVNALRDFWFYEGYHYEGLQWAQRAIDHSARTGPSLQAGLLITAGVLSDARQDTEQGFEYFERALSRVSQLHNDAILAWCLIFYGHSMAMQSNCAEECYATAVNLVNEGNDKFRELDDIVGLAQGLNIEGNIHTIHGNQVKARTAYEACLDICRKSGERRREMIMLANLSSVSAIVGNYAEAKKLARQSLLLYRETEFRYMAVLELGRSVPASLAGTGHTTQAARMLGASAALRAAMNIRQQPVNLLDTHRIETSVRSDLGDTNYQIAYETGQTLSLEEAIAAAINGLD